MRIAAFTKYDRAAASTRQRFLQFEPALDRAGMQLSLSPLLGDDYILSLATGGPVAPGPIIAAYLKRFARLVGDPGCDLIWVYAEAFPYLPAWFERLLFRSGKPVVYDFDDAFFVNYDDHPSFWVRSLLSGKLDPIMAGAAAVCCGNKYLLDHASRLNSNCLLLPTVVDTSLYQPKKGRGSHRPVIGWIGSPSTWPEVTPLLPVLQQLCRAHEASFRVVGAGAAARSDMFDGMELVDWTEASEIAQVQQFDIGIMPLRDLPFQRGKSGYKLVQYMACGLPVVASPVGINCEMVGQDVNGFLASSSQEWKDALSQLLRDAELRNRMGSAGRQKAEQHYSLQVHAPRLVALFRSLAVSE